MNLLTQHLIEAGLIQFGWFQHGKLDLPVMLRLEMLVSYPETLNFLVQTAQELSPQASTDRVLCSADSVPFGVAYSLQTGIPLVYSHGTDRAPVFDLVGAYDIGHPALLITNTIGWQQSPERLIRAARSVGLEIHTLLTILEVRPQPSLAGIKVQPLLRLGEVVRDLTTSNQLARGQAQAVLNWIEAD